MRFIEHTPKRWAEFVGSRYPITDSIVPLNTRGQRHWSKIGDEWMSMHARWAVADARVEGKKELQLFDKGLYFALWKRKLLDSVELDEKRRKWYSMSEADLIGFAKGFIADEGILGRSALEDADPGLYDALRRRRLISQVGLGYVRRKCRNWIKMGRRNLVKYARAFIAKMGIEERKDLGEADPGLHTALKKRKLLDEVFSRIDRKKHTEAVQGVLDALESFGEES